MSASFFLSFREGLEAALIIGIILSQLIKIKRPELAKFVFLGTIIGFIVTVVGGFVSFNTINSIGEGSEVLLEGWLRLIAAGLIVYFLVWLHKNHNVSADIQTKVQSNANNISLFVLSFLTVFREGMELMVFNLTQMSQNATNIVYGSILGLLAAIIVGYAIFKTTVKLNLSLIFKGLGVILIFLGGEMFAEGLTELIGGGEALEISALILFIVSSLYIFLKNDIQKQFGKKELAE